MKDKEVLSTNGYAVLPFDQPTPGAPIEVPKVAAKAPEVPKVAAKVPEIPKVEAQIPEAKMKKPLMNAPKLVEVPEVPKVEKPKMAAPKLVSQKI